MHLLPQTPISEISIKYIKISLFLTLGIDCHTIYNHSSYVRKKFSFNNLEDVQYSIPRE